ncbi:Protein kinase-like domain protein [Acrodontium crateriforme]|uniref:Protein kinase-like domain protein n=1 Tax=Acrodontium crateriforme TaxID=150365 RepID=A0AAQ3LWI2_9PEZI|nr:Protein kinase-like domain protein [Acrodontium crateriforme]
MSSQEELEELRARLRESERRREEAERLNQETTLPEYIDACHSHLFLGLIVQDVKSSTKGDPANAERKLRPDHIREWQNFHNEQQTIWDALMDSEFSTERHFRPLFMLQVDGKELRERRLGSELDLGFFERQTVERPVEYIIKQIAANPPLRKHFRLQGNVKFENHANTLNDGTTSESELISTNLGEPSPRRSERLAAAKNDEKTKPKRPPRPRADQICVYDKGRETKVPAFIIEYKAPHKLSLAHIKAGLVDMDLEEIVRFQARETPTTACKRVVAAVITQAYSYMVTGGLPFGYVCTGEAFIFLQVKHDDPSTAYYFLSVPKEDVGDSTGWESGHEGDNKLHVTAVGQALAFTLRALQATPRNSGWIRWAEENLQKWEMVYDDILDAIEEKDIPSSAFKPPTRSRNAYCRMSPVRTRSKAVLSSVASCNSPQIGTANGSDEDPDDEFPPDTPTRSDRQPRMANTAASSRQATTHASKNSENRGENRKYCTQRCLRGLISRGPLDPTCPNVLDHGIGRHGLSKAKLLSLLAKQMSPKHLCADTQLGCESLHIHGLRGALFKVTLFSHGYTFLGKGVPWEHVGIARYEESIYDLLVEIQGIHVPVLLGGIDVHGSLYYDGIVQIVHLMLMSYSGKNIDTAMRELPERRDQLIANAESSLRAIQRFGILHSDPIPANILWNSVDDQVMIIDLERARIPERGTPLMPISSNRRLRQDSVFTEDRNALLPRFDREVREMKNNLLRYI